MRSNIFTGRGLLAISLALLLALSGCSTPSHGTEREGLLVYTSFYPMYDFAAKVGGERAEVINLVPAGVEPHDWEPTPRDISGLERADLLVYSGAGMEHWVEGVAASLDGSGLVVLETSAGLTERFEHDEHDDEHGHGFQDPHVWLSPRRAKAQMESICQAMAELDPDGADYYQSNWERWAAEFDKLDQEFRETLEPLPGRSIVVAHQAFGYLCADYGLTQVSAQGFSPDGEPNPAQMARTVDFCREHGIRVVFFEELTSPRVAEIIAEEIGAETGVLIPIEGLGEESLAAGEDYFSLMRNNLEALAYALG